VNENPNVERDIPPPYDLIGDVHGCIDELTELLNRLGYHDAPAGGVEHPAGRTLVFVGDLADRGPGNMPVWKLALATVEAGNAIVTPGNHDRKFARYLMGRNVVLNHGLELTAREYRAMPPREQRALRHGVQRLVLDGPPYAILDGGNLVVAHAGIEEWMIGKTTEGVVAFVRYGEKTGELTPEGLPIRRDWAAEYRGRPLVVYGHTPTPVAAFRNNTINIDQGCAFGGSLSALRYPERDIVTVPARRVYAPPSMRERTWSPAVVNAE
jgi:diadenosine tetraphosphatase ApaH/serine/threonine PP2A family protein phosphatase